MQFADYNAFRVAVQWLIEGEENTGTFSANTLDLMIGLGEARVYNGDGQTPGLRASSMVTTLTVAIEDNAAELPANLLELKEVYFPGEKPLDIIPLDRLRALEADGELTGGVSRFCAQDGDTLRFWPAATDSPLALDLLPIPGDLGSYYAKPAALETALNATFNRYPELFVYAALFECALFLGFAGKAQAWEAKYRQLADGANHAERMRVYGGGPLRVRTR